MLRLKRSLKRFDFGTRVKDEPADRAWQRMLARVAAEDAERRFAALEQALNEGAARRD